MSDGENKQLFGLAPNGHLLESVVAGLRGLADRLEQRKDTFFTYYDFKSHADVPGMPITYSELKIKVATIDRAKKEGT